MNTELEDLPIEWDEEQEAPEGLPMPKVLLEETAGRKLHKDKMRESIAKEIKAFLKAGGKITKLKMGESNDLYGNDPSPQTEARLNKLINVGKTTTIKWCKQSKRWEVRRGCKVIKMLYTMTSAEEYCREENERMRKCGL